MPMLTAFDVYRYLLPRRSTPTRNAIRTAMTVWRARHVAKGRDGYSAAPTESVTPLDAYVNHGRWLVDCPTCGNSPMITPRGNNEEAPCFVCGTIWTRIRFPRDVNEIENLLLLRGLRKTQNWTPGETVEQLRDENTRNGVGRPQIGHRP